MIVPLVATPNGKPIFVLSLVCPLDEKTDLLQVLYNRSPIALISAIPTMNSTDKMRGGRILTMNQKAREILKLTPASQPIYHVGQLLAHFRDNLFWARTAVSMRKASQRLTLLTQKTACTW